MTDIELSPKTTEWVLNKMEALTREVLINPSIWEKEIIIEKIGMFRALSELLANSGFETLGLKFKIEIPTLREFEFK